MVKELISKHVEKKSSRRLLEVEIRSLRTLSIFQAIVWSRRSLKPCKTV